jgi:hypothetical protein
MRFADLSRTLLRVQYQIARIPLQLLDEQLVARLDSDARLRLFYQRSLGLLDAAVGNVLGSPTLAQRGATKIERTDKLMRAADLDAQANATIAQANSKLRHVRGAAAQATEDAHAERRKQLIKHKKTPTSASVRHAKRPISAPTPPKSRPMTRPPFARARPMLPSRYSTPSFAPTRSSPRPTRKPSSMMRRVIAASLHANTPGRIGLRIWSTKRKPSAAPRSSRCGRKRILAWRLGNSTLTAVGRLS